MHFTCTERDNLLPVNEWGRHEIITAENKTGSVGALLLSLDSESSELRDSFCIKVPHKTIANFEAHHLQQLGLPKPSMFRLHIRGEGNLAHPDFRFHFHFARINGQPLLNPSRFGSFLTDGTSQTVLLDPIFSLAEKMDTYNELPEEDMDARFLAWGEIKELLPDNVIVDNYLSAIKVAPADAFTLEITGSNSLDFNPILVQGTIDTSNEDIPQEKKPSFRPLLPPEHQQAFNKKFWKSKSVRNHYAIGNGWFIAIPRTLQKVLSIAHSYKLRPAEDRRAFLANPRQVIVKQLGAEISEDILEDLFFESPEFLSDRIKYLGIWQPKTGVFLLPSDQDWLAGNEELGIPIDDSIVRVSVKDLPELIDLVKEAKQAKQKFVQFKGQKIPATDAALKALSLNLPEQKPDSTKNKGKCGTNDSPSEKTVPIIIDHLSKLGYEKSIIKRDGEVGSVPNNLKSILLQHQKKGVIWLQDNWVHGRPGCLLADDMGLGKTFQALVFMAWVKGLMVVSLNIKNPMLIVAPTGLLKNWEDEIHKHLLPPELGLLYRAYGAGFRALRGVSETQAAHELSNFDLVLTTYETLRDYIKIFIKISWSVVAFDEVQKIKNPAALMTDMAKSLAASFSVALTGTPIENRLADLWCILDTVYPGRLGTLKQFSQKYESKNREKQAGQCIELKKTLMDENPVIMLRRMKEDHLDGLPLKTTKIIEVEMPEIQAQAYHVILREARNNLSEPGKMLQTLQSLRSVSLHPYTSLDADIDDEYINNSARLKATIDILDKIFKDNEKALIFLESLDMQQLLVPYLQKRYHLNSPPMVINGSISGQKRHERVQKFQDSTNDNFDVMILSPKAGGVGLTLTAANHVIHLSRWWNPAVEDQCTDRVYRIGQDKNVTIYFPLALHPELGEHSFDSNLHNLLEKKRQLSRDVLAPPAGTDQDMADLFNDTIRGFSASKHKTFNMDQIDLLEPVAFERMILAELAHIDYEVKTTPVTRDFGADGIALAPTGSGKNNLIIQCKHTQGTRHCSEDAVFEIVKSLEHYQDLPRPFKAVVVTNAHGFTKKAKLHATMKSVLLVDRFSLFRWLSSPDNIPTPLH